MGQRIKRLIKVGWHNTERYRTRSEADRAVVTALRRVGHTPGEIKAVFANRKWGIGDRYREIIAQEGEDKADRQLQRCIVNGDAFLAKQRATDGPAVLFTPPTLLRVLARVARCAARARALVTSWEDASGIAHSTSPTIEQPHRLVTLLYNLARGHALLFGRRRLAAPDVRLAIRVALDSLPLQRRQLLRVLIADGPRGSLSSESPRRSIARGRRRSG